MFVIVGRDSIPDNENVDYGKSIYLKMYILTKSKMNIRRYYIPDMIYFIVGVTYQRESIFADETNLNIFRETLRKVKEIHPFTMQAYAFLPDHFHLLIKPCKMTDITKILHSAQRNFTINLKKAKGITHSLKSWQHRFWDHIIRDEEDYERHFDYIHYNPVKHGYVMKPEDWSHSSYHHYLEKEYYKIGWGHIEPEAIREMDFE